MFMGRGTQEGSDFVEHIHMTRGFNFDPVLMTMIEDTVLSKIMRKKAKGKKMLVLITVRWQLIWLHFHFPL